MLLSVWRDLELPGQRFEQRACIRRWRDRRGDRGAGEWLFGKPARLLTSRASKDNCASAKAGASGIGAVASIAGTSGF